MRADGRIVWRTLLVVAALHGSAGAEPSFLAPPRSTALFVEGRQLATSGKVEEACQRFEESWQLEHALGTALNLGNCRERDGHLLEAWQLYQDAARAADDAHQPDRAAFARNRSTAIEARLTMLEISLAPPIAAGISITINGQPVATQPTIRQWLEPGPVEIRATTPDGGAHAERLDPHPGALHVTVPSLVRTRVQRRHRYVVAAGTLVAAGAVTAGIGVWFANVAASEHSDFLNWSAVNCPANSAGNPTCGGRAYDVAVRKVDEVQRLSNISTGLLIGGAVATGAAAVIWWKAPKERIAITPVLTTTSIDIAVTARF